MSDRAYMPQAKSGDWGTPQWLFDGLNKEFLFTVDAAASKLNAKCERYWTEHEDGLVQPWQGESVYVNPPFFAPDLRAWSRKAWAESRKPGTVVVMLVPVKSDQPWWHRYAIQTEVRFMLGRIKFEGAKHHFPKDTAVLVYGRGIGPRMRSMKARPVSA